MVGLQTLALAIGVRVPASQPSYVRQLRAAAVIDDDRLPVSFRYFDYPSLFGHC